MNSDKHRAARTGGNAMIYILLALALLGGLTMVIAQQNDQASGENLTGEKAELLALKMVAYAGSAKNVVDQMMMSGTNINNLAYVTPNQSSFDTSPYINKIYHPQGGGLNYEPGMNPSFTITGTPPGGWYMGRFNNIEWTPTTASDVMITAYKISKSICESINVKITGSKTIPALAGSGDPLTYLVDTEVHGLPNATLTETVCAACKGYPSLCVSNGAADTYAYYNIISGQ